MANNVFHFHRHHHQHEAACSCGIDHKAEQANLNRRHFLKLAGGAGAALLAGAAFTQPTVARAASIPMWPGYAPLAEGEGSGMTPEQALKALMEGNARYVTAKRTSPHQDEKRRIELAKGQAPFATILSCSDSRVPPELLFDQGLGDLFVLRTAGNTLADVVVGSIEYAVSVLKCPLIMVLGHEKCGAVDAAVQFVTKKTTYPGQIQALAKNIAPAVEKVKDMKGDLLDNAVKANAVMGLEQLEQMSTILSDAYKAHKIGVVAARYDLDEGKVEIVE